MRVAHIILTHKNPAQLVRLIKSMQHPQFDFYVHADAKVALETWKVNENFPDVTFIKKRVECNWGGFTIVQAIFNAISEVLASGKTYDFINLLSGQDYPINSPENIYNFLLQHPGKNFIAYDESHQTDWWRTAADRYEKYHFTDLNFRGRFFAERIVNMIAPARKVPDGTILYGGNKATWWTISGECAAYMNNEFNHSPRLINFLRFCWGTDEIVIPTLIMNSVFKNQVVNDNLRYIDWSEGNASPKSFDISDFDKISRSKMLFARKFDLDHDEKILNKIDQTLLTNKQ